MRTRRVQHGDAVVDEQAARRIESQLRLQLRPELRVFLRHAEVVRADDAPEVARQPGLLGLDFEHVAMRVGDQHRIEAAPVQRLQEPLGTRQEAHVRAHFALQLRNVERQLAAPEIDAVPVQRSLLGDEQRRELARAASSDRSWRRA